MEPQQGAKMSCASHFFFFCYSRDSPQVLQFLELAILLTLLLLLDGVAQRVRKQIFFYPCPFSIHLTHPYYLVFCEFLIWVFSSLHAIICSCWAYSTISAHFLSRCFGCYLLFISTIYHMLWAPRDWTLICNHGMILEVWELVRWWEGLSSCWNHVGSWAMAQ